jgi:hypothetical protein
VENLLQVDYGAVLGFLETSNTILQVLWKCHIRENLQIGVVQELQPGFSLHFPQLAISVDNSIAYTRLAKVDEVYPSSLPNKSQDLLLKKSPLEKMPSFFRTYSRFLGSLMTTPGGRLGTEI